MKLHFEANLDYQLQAIESVCDLFRGQDICRNEFTVTLQPPGGQSLHLQQHLGIADTELGTGNRLTLTDEQLLDNLRQVQARNGLAPASSLASGDFSIEMETGTGKTYVYLRTIFELNKRYGFTKFVIVVPSVAIKEGVYKSVQVTEEHFKSLYAGVPFECFLYDPTRPGPVRNFATSSSIQIMVATVGAINKQDINRLYKLSEKTGGEKPIDLIRATRPILIVDEPQSVDGGLRGSGKKALEEMHPLCTLRYSATHAHQHHMVFRLDAVDAYERKLVKQIEVAAATVEDAHNTPYVRFIAPVYRGSRLVGATLELDVLEHGKVRRVAREVLPHDALDSITGHELYRGYSLGAEIIGKKGKELLELRLPGDEVWLSPGQAHGDVDLLAMQRAMIRRTIIEHLEKEVLLRPRGIKVLSLFFIDSVARYREYDSSGQERKGVYASIFEEEYRLAARRPAFQALFAGVDPAEAAARAHDGYFSIDKRNRWTEPQLDGEGLPRNDASRADAERGYNLIMKDKEKLLSFDTPLRFIFSHSALKEGWDNPNIFQICALREMGSERERRQTLGRGLRLCVNQQGERVRGFEVNRLTVIANESYQSFADKLQSEIEADTGIRFGVVQQQQLAGLAIPGEDGKPAALGAERSALLWQQLRQAGHIDAQGRVQPSLKIALKEGNLDLPPESLAWRAQLQALLRKVSSKVEINNRDERIAVPLRQAGGKSVILSDEFRSLWDRIKHKTTYRVRFDNDRLLADCIAELAKAPPVARARLQWRKAAIAIGRGGVEAAEKEGATTVTLEQSALALPDLLTDLQDRTQLTRRSLVKILTECGRLEDCKRNPQQFIEQAAQIINRRKRLALVDGIRYQKLGQHEVYAQELFEREELSGYLTSMLRDAKKSVHAHVVLESGPEREFADALEKQQEVILYAKLPAWFKVPTPLGAYNPDWAVLLEKDGAQRLYFVVETKGSTLSDDLRLAESAKIVCGKAHFQALAEGENPARYAVARTLDDVLAGMD